ncbi:MAG: hypothetical protein U1E40_03000 [Amaricoccus sp.]
MPRKTSDATGGESPRETEAPGSEALPPPGAESAPGEAEAASLPPDPVPVTVDVAAGDGTPLEPAARWPSDAVDEPSATPAEPVGEPATESAGEPAAPTESAEEPVMTESAEEPAVPAEPVEEPAESAEEPVAAAPVVREAPAERVVPAAAAVETHEEHEDEGGWSFAARALAALLLLIAGAALGIWGAPKLAPMLPSGLAPAAEWLTPGRSEAEAQVAALQARVDQGLSGMDARIADLAKPDDVDARIQAAVDAAGSQAQASIAALKATVDGLAGSDAAQQVAQLASALDGQKAELAALKDQISGAAAATGQLNEDAVKKIDVYRAELDGLRGEFGSLQEKVAGFASRLDEVAASAQRQVETAKTQVSEIQTQANTALSAAEAQAAVAQIHAAMEGGQPFAAAVKQLGGPSGIAVPDGLSAAADAGVPTLAALRASFPDAAHDAIRASIEAKSGDGILARSRAFLEAQIATRSLTPQEGSSADAVLSRMEEQLRQGNLAGAIDEAGKLPPDAAAAMSGWLDAARARNAAVEGMATLDATLSGTN